MGGYIFTPYQDLVSFGLTDALDVQQLFFRSVRYGLYGVEPCVLQLLQVTRTDATLLYTHTRYVRTGFFVL